MIEHGNHPGITDLLQYCYLIKLCHNLIIDH